MARTDRRRRVEGRSRAGWWWLALPALGLAAYAAFTATLGMLGEDATRVPAAVKLDVPASASAPAAVPPRDAVPAVPAAEMVAAPDVATSPPAPSATPATQRAAAGDARAVKRKPAPQEHLTDQDRRALEDVLEKAAQGSR